MNDEDAHGDPAEESPLLVDYETAAISRPEYIQALVHLYRGELYRATAWRMRLDTTTNWAILTTAGLLSFSFSGREHGHWVLLLGILLIFTLLGYEARRFRFFDVWRYRVRMMEENFYGPILRRDPISPDLHWGDRVARDLLEPHFKLGFRAAIRARFTRNYWAIFGVTMSAWCLKVTQDPVPASDWVQLKMNLSTGGTPWWVPLGFFCAILCVLMCIVFLFPKSQESETAYWREHDVRRDVSSLDA